MRWSCKSTTSQLASLSDAVLCDVTPTANKAKDDGGCEPPLSSLSAPPRSVLQARRQVSRLGRERDGLARRFLTWPCIGAVVCVCMRLCMAQTPS